MLNMRWPCAAQARFCRAMSWEFRSRDLAELQPWRVRASYKYWELSLRSRDPERVAEIGRDFGVSHLSARFVDANFS